MFRQLLSHSPRPAELSGRRRYRTWDREHLQHVACTALLGSGLIQSAQHTSYKPLNCASVGSCSW